MNFLEQSKKAKGPANAYLITLCIVIISTLLSGFMSGLVAQSVFGFDLGGTEEETLNKSVVLGFQLLPFVGSFIALLLCIKFIHKQPLLSAFTARENFDWKRFFTAFGIWFGVMLSFLIFGVALGAPIYFEFDLYKFLPLLLICIVLLPIQTAAEDLLFRSVLFQGLGSQIGKGFLALLILGVLFGWIHAGNPEVKILGEGVIIFYVWSGVFLGLLTHLNDGMELGMGYHLANNLFGAVVLTNNWQVFQTDAMFVDYSAPSFGWDVLLTMCVMHPALLFTFYKIYKWKGVKEKFLN